MDSFSYDPDTLIENEELAHAFYSFCTYCHCIYGKKINFATIFTKILSDEKIKAIYKIAISEPSDFEAFRLFIKFEPSIAKRKYITKVLNRRNK